MSTKSIIILLVLVAGLLFISVAFLPVPEPQNTQPVAKSEVENYLKDNINTLSPERSVLGGTFFVTNIELDNENGGTVEYEDGHNAYKATFKYSLYDSGTIEVGDFSIIPTDKLYQSDKLGIRFIFPGGYHLEEGFYSSTQYSNTTITLTENTDENRKVREGQAPGREGPTSISVLIYQGPEGQRDVENWIRQSPDSNFDLSNGVLNQTSIGGVPGLSYKWSGLYEGESHAVSRDGLIYLFSVTYLNPSDKIRNDFDTILKSVSFF